MCGVGSAALCLSRGLLFLNFLESPVGWQWCSAFAEDMAVSKSKLGIHGSPSRKETKWTWWFEKVTMPWSKAPRRCERNGRWWEGSCFGSGVQDRPLCGLGKEHSKRREQQQMPRAKSELVLLKNRRRAGWLEESKIHKMGIVRAAGAFGTEFGFYSLCSEKLLECFKQRSDLHFLRDHWGFCMEIRL